MGRKIQSIGKYNLCHDLLGKGSFATVELVFHDVTKCEVAMKIINTRKICEDYVRSNLYREARILSQMNHPNIIRFYESLRADIFYCLVTECAQGGELSDYMKTFDDKRFPEEVARHYLRQLLSAMQYMHERGVVHRNLKMENLLLDKSKRHLKLVGFGLSNHLGRTELLSTHCGSPEYAAPELFTPDTRYGPEVDVWSFGVLLYISVTGVFPFYSPYYDHARRQRLSAIIKKGLSDIHDKEMAHLSRDCQALIKEVLEPIPQIRLPLEEIIMHPWVTDQTKLTFTPYFPRSKLIELKSQIMENLADATNLKKIEIERFVHETATNELSAMFKMLLEEAKVKQGFYDEDHTNRPISIVQERKRYLALMKWRKLRYRLKESARVFKEIINSRESTDILERHDYMDARDEAMIKKNEAKLKRLKIRKKVNPVGIVKTEKKKEFFPPKRSLMQQMSTMEVDDKSISQLRRTRSRPTKIDSGVTQNSTLSGSNQKIKQSPVLLQRKVTTNHSAKKYSSMKIKNKDVTKQQILHASDDNYLSNKSLSRYQSSTKKNIVQMAPFANIDEVDNHLLETASFLDEYEPRYCLVTDSNLSSRNMLSSTVSEISEGKSLDFSNDINELQDMFDDKQNACGSETDIQPIFSPRLSRDSQYLCNGAIPSNELMEDL